MHIPGRTVAALEAVAGESHQQACVRPARKAQAAQIAEQLLGEVVEKPLAGRIIFLTGGCLHLTLAGAGLQRSCTVYLQALN